MVVSGETDLFVSESDEFAKEFQSGHFHVSHVGIFSVKGIWRFLVSLSCRPT